jgi:protease PrsW
MRDGIVLGATVGFGFAAQPIAVWLTLLMTATPVRWQLIRLGQVPAVTQTQVHLFTFLERRRSA